jgi:hypothetical protein
VDALVARGIANLETQEFQSAMEDFREARSIHPNVPSIEENYRKALSLLKQGKQGALPCKG